MEVETMLDFIKKVDVKKTGIFAAGVAFGTATNIQENAEDIYAEAQQINEDRAAAETEEFEDVEEVSEETTDVEEDTAE